jgi:hypothetical protein
MAYVRGAEADREGLLAATFEQPEGGLPAVFAYRDDLLPHLLPGREGASSES